MPNRTKPVIAVSIGDPNGIGPEVILKTFSDPRILESCDVIVFGSMNLFNYYRKSLDINQIQISSLQDTSKPKSKTINVVNCISADFEIKPGTNDFKAGKVAFQSLEKACEAMKAGHADVLLTAPINKENIQSDDFKFPGHTEYLASYFESDQFAMMLCGHHSKVALVTGHVPISQVANGLSQEKILAKLKVVNASLKKDFLIRKPKIAVLGLNPHAGDGGLLGKEELEIIKPAIDEAQNLDILAFGPYPADGFWAKGMAKNFDLVLAMYHDQGLVPFKAMEFSSGVNFTAGLSIIRTSPDHGTAFDIAGKNQANPDSFREALYMGIDIYGRQTFNEKLDEVKLVP